MQSSQQVFLKNKSVSLCFFFIVVFFCCGKVFFSAFFLQNVFFFLYHDSESQVLQIFIVLSKFLGDSLINFPQNLILPLEGQ